MSSEFTALREAWLALDEPSEEVREAARAQLFEEIASEESERLGESSDPQLRRGGLRRRSRLALVFVFVLLLLLTWATLTLAFNWHVIFSNAPKAKHSSKVFKEFSTLDVLAPPGMASGVIANETRLVATFGRKRLWVAPTRSGGYCFAIGGGGCDHLGALPLSVTYAMRGRGLGGDLGDLREVFGTVNPRWSDTLELRFEDGTVVRPRIAWISDPISQGFFYVPIGADHRRAGHRLREVVALDAAGNLVDSDSMSQPGLYSDRPPAGAIVDEADQVARLDTPSGEAVLWSAPSRFDTSCTWLTLAGHFYLGTCFHKGSSAAPEVELVKRGELVLVRGLRIPSSDVVRLDFADGHHVRLRPNGDGFLLYRVAQPASLASGQPWSYTVATAGGKKVLRSDLSLPYVRSPADFERPVRLPDGQEFFLPRKAIVSKARKLIEIRTEQGGRETVWIIPARDGGNCYVFSRGGGCAPPGSHAPLLGAGMNGGGSPVLLAGEVREDVATYELRYEDGAIERVHPVENFILHEIPSSHYARGHRLELLIARARDGHELGRQAIRASARGVYPCKNPTDIGGGGTVCP